MEHTYGLIGGNIFHGELSGRPAVPQPAGGGLRRLPLAGRRASTRPTRPPTAAAGCAASRAGRPPGPCWPTAVRRAGGGRGGRWRDAPAARSCRRRGAAGGAAALRAEPHAAAGRVRRRGRPGVGAPVVLRRRLGVRRPGGRAGRAGRPAGREDRHAPACCWSGGPTASCGRSPTSAATAATSCWPAGRPRTAASIQCPYHAWSYELDGRLRLAPRFDGAENFDPSEFPLSPVRSEEWGGWIFVNVSGGAPAFSEALGTLADVVAPYECERLVPAATHTYDARGQLEAAPRELPRVLPLPADPSRAVPGQPARLSGDNYDDHTGAWVGGTMDLADGRGDDVARRPLGGVRRSAASRRRSCAASSTSGVFPNLLLSLHPDYVMTHRVRTAHHGHDLGRVPVAVPARGRRTARLRPVLRRRLLGPHQPPGLVGGRERAAGPGLAGLRARRVRRAGGRGVPASSTMVARGYLGEALVPQPSYPSQPARPATRTCRREPHRRPAGRGGAARARGGAGRPVLGRRGRRRRAQRPDRGGLPGPGRASRCSCSSDGSGSAAPARSSGPSPTSATWCRPAPTWWACSTSS